MSTGYSGNSQVRRVQAIADYQFGGLCGTGVFPEGCEFQLSSTGRIRQVHYEGKRLATVRAQDGRLTLGIEGARRLQACIPPPRNRVVVVRDVAEFIAQGKNVFAKHVASADYDIRAGDEVLVVTEDERILACGMAVLSGADMQVFKYGGAVKVRQGSA